MDRSIEGPHRPPASQPPRRYDASVRRPLVRLAVGLVGLAVGVVGVASLTGGWLGFPSRIEYGGKVTTDEGTMESWTIRDGGSVTGIGLVVVGLGLVAVAAWQRRTKPRPPIAA
jgi:ferric-dicitrate binding protein FerR (iron transport regulator)